jgi:type IV secretory pathway TraG/TraD family ATPase VirD4
MLDRKIQAVRSRLQQKEFWRSKGGRFFFPPLLGGLALGALGGLWNFPGNLIARGISNAIGSLFGLTLLGAFFGAYLGAFILLCAILIERGDQPTRVITLAVIGLLFAWIPLIGLPIPFLLVLLARPGDPNRAVQRGTKVVSTEKLQQHLNRREAKSLQSRQDQQPHLTIGGVRLPNYLENLSFFFVGSPGSGKTVAISEVVQTLRQRPDWRVLILDRNGELMEKLFQDGDLIFNPSDERSVSWSHVNEPTRPETLAASLIPDSGDEPFWSEAARSLLSDLYSLVSTPAEVWEVVSTYSLEEIKELIRQHDGVSSRYLENDRTGSGVLSTLVNQARFYRELAQVPQDQPFSFLEWGRQDDPRWVFLPLFEDDSELFKPLYSTAFELVIRGMLSNENRRMKTAIVIDELGALNRLPSLSRLLSESRKFGGAGILGTQTEAQIDKTYGQEDKRIVLQGCATKLILNCRDSATAESFAKAIGQQERRDITRGGSFSFKGGSSSSDSEVIRETYAVLPSELQALPPLQGYLAIADGSPPARVEVLPQNYPNRTDRLKPRSTQPTKTRQPLIRPTVTSRQNGEQSGLNVDEWTQNL